MFKQLLRANHASSCARGATVSMNCKICGIYYGKEGRNGCRLRKDSIYNEIDGMIEKRNKKVIFNFFWFEGDIETWVQGYKKTFDRHFHLCLSTNENGHREEDERTVGTAYENWQRAERLDEEERGILKARDKKDRGDSSTDYKGIVDHACR